MNEKTSFTLTTPIAVIIAGLIIAGAIVFTNTTTTDSTNQIAAVDSVETGQIAPQGDPLEAMLPIDKNDHVRGAKNPKVTIVEYSDYECPFCKRFHNTMLNLVDKYPNNLAWVYRHWPIEGLHPVKARREALAAECAADQKGSDGFWEFSDRFMELTPSNNRTNLEKVLPQIADEMGLNQKKFFDCIDSEKFADKVDHDTENALATGGSGTPWSIIILPDGTKVPLNGAQPEEAISKLIDSVLGE